MGGVHKQETLKLGSSQCWDQNTHRPFLSQHCLYFFLILMKNLWILAQTTDEAHGTTNKII